MGFQYLFKYVGNQIEKKKLSDLLEKQCGEVIMRDNDCIIMQGNIYCNIINIITGYHIYLRDIYPTDFQIMYEQFQLFCEKNMKYLLLLDVLYYAYYEKLNSYYEELHSYNKKIRKPNLSFYQYYQSYAYLFPNMTDEMKQYIQFLRIQEIPPSTIFTFTKLCQICFINHISMDYRG